MTREELLQDVAYARAIAEEGRQAPLLGGPHLIFWGALNAAAFLAHWAGLNGYTAALGSLVFAAIWFCYGVVAMVGMSILRLRTLAKPGKTSIGAKAEQAVWAGAGIALLAIVIGAIGRMMLTQDPTAPNNIMGAGFAVYAAALFAVAALARQSWMRRFAWLSGGVALTLCLFANATWAYAFASGASLLVLAWPGLVLLKNEPAAAA
jgi:hypothetical protein